MRKAIDPGTEAAAIVADEQSVLDRVRRLIDERTNETSGPATDYGCESLAPLRRAVDDGDRPDSAALQHRCGE